MRAVGGKLLRIGRRFTGSTRPIVLMYHRVANLVVDPWRMAVAPERFAIQIEILKRNRDIVPMHWLAKKLREGLLPNRAAAITFDDGYADVFENALPVLQRSGCPATMFITTEAINGTGFWWDVLSKIVLEIPRLPPHLKMKMGSERLEWDLPENNSVGRGALHSELHARLKLMDRLQRNEALYQLASWAGVTVDLHMSSRVMTANEVHQLATTEGIEIGAHTVTHASLPLLNSNDLRNEVADSVRECRALSGKSVLGFAYPFGDHDDACVKAVEAAGLQYAVTNISRELHSKTHPFRIPRILVADWSEAEFVQEVLTYG